MKNPEYPVILFDGGCNLCNGLVKFIIKYDSRNIYKFASLQSEAAEELLRPYNISSKKSDTVILLDHGKIYDKSDAVLRISKELNKTRFLYYIFSIFPRFIRNTIYKVVSRYRFKIFGRSKGCILPTPENKNKFL